MWKFKAFGRRFSSSVGHRQNTSHHNIQFKSFSGRSEASTHLKMPAERHVKIRMMYFRRIVHSFLREWRITCNNMTTVSELLSSVWTAITWASSCESDVYFLTAHVKWAISSSSSQIEARRKSLAAGCTQTGVNFDFVYKGQRYDYPIIDEQRVLRRLSAYCTGVCGRHVSKMINAWHLTASTDTTVGHMYVTLTALWKLFRSLNFHFLIPPAIFHLRG